jgi:hypothetical protein
LIQAVIHVANRCKNKQFVDELIGTVKLTTFSSKILSLVCELQLEQGSALNS